MWVSSNTGSAGNKKANLLAIQLISSSKSTENRTPPYKDILREIEKVSRLNSIKNPY